MPIPPGPHLRQHARDENKAGGCADKGAQIFPQIAAHQLLQKACYDPRAPSSSPATPPSDASWPPTHAGRRAVGTVLFRRLRDPASARWDEWMMCRLSRAWAWIKWEDWCTAVDARQCYGLRDARGAGVYELSNRPSELTRGMQAQHRVFARHARARVP